jgi:cytochrome P450
MMIPETSTALSQHPLRQGQGSPPGPKGLPILGSLPRLGRDVLGFFEECSTYGDVAGFSLAGWNCVLLNHPDLAEYVFVKHHRNFVKHSFFWRHVTAIFGQGLLTSEGEIWQRQRRLAAPAFSTARLSRYGEIMAQHAEEMVQRWPSGEAIDVHREVMELTLRIAAKTLFDANTPSDVAEIHDGFEDVLVEISARFRRPFRIPDGIPTPGNLRYRRGLKRIDKLVARIIEDRQRSPGDRGDLLSILMAARDDAGHPMSHQQVRDEAVTLLLAGHETTALTLSWTWHLLARHPAADGKLTEEIQEVLNGRLPTPEDLPRLRWAEYVVNEALRLYPPAYAIGREAVADCEIGGYAVPAGTTIFVTPWVTHRDPRWYDEPLQFKPERWSHDFARSLPRFAFMPFGGGPRICIGNRFAMMEAVLILVTVAQRYKLETRTDHRIEPLASITLRPKGGVWVNPMLRGTQ